MVSDGDAIKSNRDRSFYEVLGRDVAPVPVLRGRCVNMQI